MNASLLKKQLPIYLVNLFAYLFCFPFPYLALMFASWPDVPQSTVMLIATVPSLASIFACFLAGGLLKKFSKKSVLISGLVINLVFGAGIFLTQGRSAWFVIIASTITGIAFGIITSASHAAYAELTPPDKLSTAFGINNAIASIGLMILNMVGGFLAKDGFWPRAYAASFLAIPVIVYAAIALPKMAPVNTLKEESARTAYGKSSTKSVITFVILVAAFAVYFMGPSGLYLNYSSYVIDVFKLGTAVETSLAASLQSAGALIGGLFVTGLVTKIFKSKAIPVCMIVIALGISLMCVVTNSIYVVYIAEFITPCMAVPIYSNFMAQSTGVIKNKDFALSIFSALPPISQTIAPYALALFGGLLGGTVISTLWASVGFIIIGGVVVVAFLAIVQKNAAKAESEV